MQDIDDSQTVTVKLDKIATVDVEISALEGALNIDNLNRQFIEPAAVALAQKINSDGLALYKDIPYVCGTPGTTPSKLEDITAVRKVLNANKVPTSGRRAVWDVEADAAFTTIPAIVNAEKSGSTAALREGSIGRLFGLDNYMSQAVKHHTAGTLSAAVKPKEATKTGATQLTLAATAVTGALKKGDILTILGDTYVVTADAAAASNEITVPIYPALKKNVTTATNVTVAGDHTANLAFVAPAFAFVTRPLVTPAGVDCYTTSYHGRRLADHYVCIRRRSMYKFKIENTELEYNFADADAVECFEKAMLMLGEQMQNVPKEKSGSEQIRYVCKSVFAVLDMIFGDGTAKKIFGATCDMMRCMNAVDALVTARYEADAQLSEQMRALNGKNYIK